MEILLRPFTERKIITPEGEFVIIEEIKLIGLICNFRFVHKNVVTLIVSVNTPRMRAERTKPMDLTKVNQQNFP